MLNEWVKSPTLIEHSLAVEAVMRRYALEYHQDPLKWGITGLVHDFDYERYPEPGPGGHPFAGSLVLESLAWPAEMREAILAHEAYTRVPRASLLAKVLFVVDELTGLVRVLAHMHRGRGGLGAVTVEEVLERIGDPRFFRALSRENLEIGLEALQMEPERHVAICLGALKAAWRRARRPGAPEAGRL
ncbi:MAG: HAD family hydrolase [Clostridia bacterium]|nr:HAD family hydrolase [Clostridia bacterium]